jgi:hypothetical protein
LKPPKRLITRLPSFWRAGFRLPAVSSPARWAFSIRKRRAPRLFLLAAAGAALGALPLLFISLIRTIVSLSAGVGGLLGLVWVGLYAFMVTSTVYYRLSGIQIR